VKTVHLIAAARPNFMKVAPLYHALKKTGWAEPVIVHTGQHYDVNMSDAFFADLMLPAPHHHLGVGSGSHAEQTGCVMIAYEKLLLQQRPDLTVVAGDVNSTVAAGLAAVKLGVRLAHLEAGLRSFDRSMPEEINRIVTDAIADLLWTPSMDASINLLKEGVPNERIDRVGNIMIDSLEMMRPRIEAQKTAAAYGLQKRKFGVVTLHRPSNVDSPDTLARLCGILGRLAARLPLVFPVHPRTRKNLDAAGLLDRLTAAPGMLLVEPLSYLQFISLIFDSQLAITDSGGIQEETTYLGIPCLTLRPNTERPITVTEGTNRLCTADQLEAAVEQVLIAGVRKPKKIEFWDGNTAHRILVSIEWFLGARIA
jgi:UDP-N-acetylglucosamine 2-epimerase (non-hydrolysing)